MTSDGINFNDFTGIKLSKFRVVLTAKAKESCLNAKGGIVDDCPVLLPKIRY